ncbi:MAG: hypothetical protein LQ351_001859 [Letrouitia transgressa]|nr:MAG: hypothetical protein LQ351_001859 [Letrouitia transgressa]
MAVARDSQTYGAVNSATAMFPANDRDSHQVLLDIVVSILVADRIGALHHAAKCPADDEEDDGCQYSDDDGSCFDPEDTQPEVQMTRESSYYGNHHWPLPCETVQQSSSEQAQNHLVLRPKSTADRIKFERPRSVSPQLVRSIPPADGSAVPYVKGRTMSLQTQLSQDLNSVPLANQYSSDGRVEEISPACHFSADTHIEALTSPAAIQGSPTEYSEISSGPESAHSLFYPGPTSQPYSLNEDANLNMQMGFPMSLSADGMSQEHPLQGQYDLGPKGLSGMEPQYSDDSLSVVQQPLIEPLVYYENIVHYHQPAPAWLENIKPEESWPGPMPSQRLNSDSWNQ